MKKNNACLLTICLLLLLFGTVSAQEVTLPADNPASQDLARLNGKLKTLEYNKDKGKAPSDYDAATIRKYLDSCKEKAPDQNWTGYETRVSDLEAMSAEANAAENARKEKYLALDAELDSYIDALSIAYDSKKAMDKSWEFYNVKAADYEAAARRIDFDRILALWEEIKQVNSSKRGDLKFTTYAGGNIEGFKAGYPNFVQEVLIPVIDARLEKSRDPNGAYALSMAQDALAFANGGLALLPGHAGLSSRQATARARSSEISKSLGTKYSGTFHADNVGKTFAANKEVSLASASAADFTDNLNTGQPLYLYQFLLGPIGSITKSPAHENGLNGYKTALVNVAVDGEPFFGTTLATDLKDDRNSSCFKLVLIPSEADMKSDWWKALAKEHAAADFSEDAINVYQSDYLYVYEKLSTLKPGMHDLSIKISTGRSRLGSGVSDEVKVKFNLDPTYYAKLTSQIKNDMVNAMQMFKPSGSEPAKEARIRLFMSDRGEVIHVSRLNDLSIREYYPEYHDKYPGKPKRRSQAFQAAWKDGAGNCYFSLVSYDEIWEGKWVDKGFYTPGSKGTPIRCENVVKN